jgi:hypothetical protein
LRAIKQILLVSISFPFLLHAQNPGYIGKKSVIAYGVELSPALEGATNLIPINLTHQLSFEHAIKSRISIGLLTRYASTIYDNEQIISDELGKPTSDYSINAFSFVPYMKFYSKNFVAPWGKYWMLGANVNATTTKHDSYMYVTKNISDHDTLLMDFGGTKQMHTSFDLLIGKGKSRIINDKIVIDYGFNFQLLSLINWISKNKLKVTQEDYIKKTAINRVQGLNRFNLYLKIGYLF